MIPYLYKRKAPGSVDSAGAAFLRFFLLYSMAASDDAGYFFFILQTPVMTTTPSNSNDNTHVRIRGAVFWPPFSGGETMVGVGASGCSTPDSGVGVAVGSVVVGVIGGGLTGGFSVGVFVGVKMGGCVGANVGIIVGVIVGVRVGALVGVTVGALVGVTVGAIVGVTFGALVGVRACIKLVEAATYVSLLNPMVANMTARSSRTLNKRPVNLSNFMTPPQPSECQQKHVCR